MSDAGIQVLERHEIIVRLKALSETDKARLLKSATILCLGTLYDPEDLLHEVVRRMLDLDRAVPRDEPFMACLHQGMRSIASAASKRERAMEKESIHADAEGGGVDIPSAAPSPEDVAIERDGCAKLERAITDLFSEDEEALMIIMGKYDDLAPDEIQQMLGIDAKRYATALRRIRRTVDKHLPTGWKP